MVKQNTKMLTGCATFACGCFWSVQAAFDRVRGVVKTTVGYTGGHLKNPSYEDVCTGSTGHAEAVEAEFDPKRVSYGELLDIFWSIHDPTQVNGQGPDTGPQYRSAIFTHSAEQKNEAIKAKEALGKSGKYAKPLATEIAQAAEFYPAEGYHQKYLGKRRQFLCH